MFRRATVNVLVIGNGVGHEIQKLRVENDSLTVQKRRFENFLKQRITNRQVEFIAEEAYPNTETIGKHLGVSWANIDMPQEIREAKGIAEEQRSRGRTPQYLGNEATTKLDDDGYQIDLKNGWVEIEPRLASDDLREQYMYEQTILEAGSAKSIILICGIIHSNKLAERFRSINANSVEVEFWECA
jgi:hypothetical protein